MRVLPKIHGLLFGVTSAEVEGSIEPHGDEWRDMGATIGPNRDKPEHLGCFKHTTRFIPSHGDGVRVTEVRVDGCDGFVHAKRRDSRVFPRGFVLFTKTTPIGSENSPGMTILSIWLLAAEKWPGHGVVV